MDELGEEVEIERGVAASLPSNGAETAHLATWVAAKDRSPPYSAGPGCLGEGRLRGITSGSCGRG